MRTVQIAHIADIHIRNYLRHKEYRKVFENLYQQLQKQKPEIIVIAGDCVHSKNVLSPEQIVLTKDLFNNLINIEGVTDVVVISGNHDCVLHNLSRLDALTPILKQFDERVRLLNDTSIYKIETLQKLKLNFCVFSILDKEKWTQLTYIINKEKADFNVGLYHGMLRKVKLDNDFVMSSDEFMDIDKTNCDIMMLGDIHRHQEVEKNVVYPGSLIQQNFGESCEKGYVLWELGITKGDVKKIKWNFVEIDNEVKYFTFHGINAIQQSKVLKKTPDAKVRLYTPSLLTQDAKRQIRKVNRNANIFFLKELHVQKTTKDNIDDLAESLEYKQFNNKVDFYSYYFEKLLETDITLNEKQQKDLMQFHINRLKFVPSIDKNKHINVEDREFDIQSLEFKGLYTYRNKVEIDFNKFEENNLIGVFGKNFSGKSNLFSVLFYAIFGETLFSSLNTSDIINDFENYGFTKVLLSTSNMSYVIERTLKRFPGGQAVTSVNFISLNESGDVTENLNLDNKKKTDSKIQSIFGSAKKFLTTYFATQSNLDYFISRLQNREKKTTIKEFLNILDLDNFIVENNKQYSRLENQISIFNEQIQKIQVADATVNELNEQIQDIERQLVVLESKIKHLHGTVFSFQTQKQYNEEIKKLQSQLDEVNMKYVSGKKPLDKMKKIIYSIQNKSNLCERDINSNKLKSENFKEIKDICQLENECAFFQEGQQAFKQYEQAQKKHTELTKQIKIIKKIYSNTKQHRISSKTIKELKKELEIFGYKPLIKDYDNLKQKHRKELIHSGEVQNKLNRKKELTTNRDELETTYDAYDKYLIYLKQLPDFIVKLMIDDLCADVNSLLSLFSEMLKIEMTIDGKKIGIFLIDATKRRPIELASGMQKTLVSLAFRCALIETGEYAMQNNSLFRIMIFDESFTTIDDENTITLEYILLTLKNSFRNIFVISHSSVFRDIVDQSVHISFNSESKSSEVLQ